MEQDLPWQGHAGWCRCASAETVHIWQRHRERPSVFQCLCSAPVTQLGTGWHSEHKEKVVRIHKLSERETESERERLFPGLSLWTQRHTKLGEQWEIFRETLVRGSRWHMCKENVLWCNGTFQLCWICQTLCLIEVRADRWKGRREALSS